MKYTRPTGRRQRQRDSQRIERSLGIKDDVAEGNVRQRLARRFQQRRAARDQNAFGSSTRSPRTNRDIPALLATLSGEHACTRSLPTGQRWDRVATACASSTRNFSSAFPDDQFALTDIVIGPQGVFEAAQTHRHEPGAVGGRRAVPPGLPVDLQVLILFPWDPEARRFLGERIWFDRGHIRAESAAAKRS